MLRVICIIIFYCVGSFSWVFGGQAPFELEQRIKNIIKPIPGQIGVAALHLESGQHVEVNGDVCFPMASTYKLPIALCCLSLVDHGKVNLDQKHVFTPKMIRRLCFVKAGECLSTREIIHLMMEKSDNAASDMILKLVGGGHVVTDWLSAHGVKHIRVDRSTLKMCADFSGITLNDDYCCTVAQCNRLMKKISKKALVAAQRKFFNDSRDTSTPNAMVDLLARMYQGKLVSAASTKFLLNAMEHCHVFGKGRIVRLLPKGCKVLHKTGKMDGMVSDVGIIELPNNKGHLALALYSNRSTTYEAQREFAMAKISKLLYDHYLNKTKMAPGANMR